MRRSNRLFEIIQILRSAGRPVTAEALSRQLEVSTRTIYRDISALQVMNTPIEGEPGIGYIMRRGYDLPPLNFDLEEIEALRVGLALLSRTGDSALQRAARRIHEKVDALHGPADWLQVAPWGAPPDDPEKGCVSVSTLRDAIRNERKLRLVYRDEHEAETQRTVRPLALVYHLECVMLAGWCELRAGFRHFRTDRIYGCDVLPDRFAGQAGALRMVWLEQTSWSTQAPDLTAH
jgi:predicted DNA-binding transcriptional regulator YafY